jgi:HEPN domain-containing protein
VRTISVSDAAAGSTLVGLWDARQACPEEGHSHIGAFVVERSADWMDQARSNLDHARHDLDAAFFEWACFSAQQAAGKAAKAVVQKMGGEAWGHSVSDLLQVLAEHHEVPDDLIDAALELDKAYIPSRYPDAHPSGTPGQRYTKSEARRLVQHAEQILQFCGRLLSSL